MNYFKKIFIVSIAIINFVGCTFHSDKKESTIKIDITFKKGDMLNPAKWQCADIEDEKICIPHSWKIVRQDKVLFLSKWDTIDVNSYFVVLKYSMAEKELSVNKYLKETYTQFKKDTVEVLMNHKLKRLIFNNKVTYFGEYITSIKGKEYLTSSTVFEKNDYIYEIALKVDSINSNLYKEQYKDILFNFYHKKRTIFSATDELKDIQMVDMSKL